MNSVKIDLSEVEEVNVGTIRCNGRVNIDVIFKDESSSVFGDCLCLYNLTLDQASSLETLFAESDNAIVEIDSRFLTITDKTWLEQNGVRT